MSPVVVEVDRLNTELQTAPALISLFMLLNSFSLAHGEGTCPPLQRPGTI